MPDAQKLKDYIDKYHLEEELSAAVNMAISQDSDDPFWVISVYLKSLSNKGQDEDDDDEHETMQEDEQTIPQMQGRGRRAQVIAPTVEIPDDWKAPKFDKSEEDRAFLLETMETNKLMKLLAPSDRMQLLEAFAPKTFDKDVAIIKQGDPGDNFYVVKDGKCDISINGKGSVMKATRGLAFGELALLHNAPRAATVTTEEGPCETFMIDMLTFKAILMGKSKQDSVDYVQFLDEVKLLDKLSKADKNTLAGSLKEKDYPIGSNIICEGDNGNTFYIIREGEVKCTKAGSTEEVSRRLKRGDFFGELALLSLENRLATVSTVVATTVLQLDRDTFTRVLGPLADIGSAGDSQGRK